jgi:exopolysaccharide biosynthesis polyprenyl glycosylphosphotransferase
MRVQTILPLFADIASLFIARSGAILLAKHWFGVASRSLDTWPFTLLLSIFAAGVMYLFDGYRRGELRRPEHELERTFKGLTVAFAAILSAEVLFVRGVPQSRYGTAFWYLFGLILVLAGRFGLRQLSAQLRKAGYGLRRSVLIGSSAGLRDFEQHLAIQRYRGYEILDFIPAPTGSLAGTGTLLSIHGIREQGDWREAVARVGAEVVVINLAEWPGSNHQVLEIARACGEMGVEVELCSSLFQTSNLTFEIDDCSGCLRLRPARRWSMEVQLALKGALDRIIGLIGSAVTLLILPVIWILLKLEDGGPLFHRREFVGCDGKVHYYLKFRTMVQNADSVLQADPELRSRFAENHKLRDDPRILRVGKIMRKLSIDEFPQFMSVLVGQMTFVGPRVISLAETERYGEHLAKRMQVKPGLTGYWQVMGRQTTTYSERILMDMFYIDHWSIWLDLVIIGKTFLKFIVPEGAY